MDDDEVVEDDLVDDEIVDDVEEVDVDELVVDVLPTVVEVPVEPGRRATTIVTSMNGCFGSTANAMCSAKRQMRCVSLR